MLVKSPGPGFCEHQKLHLGLGGLSSDPRRRFDQVCRPSGIRVHYVATQHGTTPLSHISKYVTWAADVKLKWIVPVKIQSNEKLFELSQSPKMISTGGNVIAACNQRKKKFRKLLPVNHSKPKQQLNMAHTGKSRQEKLIMINAIQLFLSEWLIFTNHFMTVAHFGPRWKGYWCWVRLVHRIYLTYFEVK